MSVWPFFQPNLGKVVIPVILISLSSAYYYVEPITFEFMDEPVFYHMGFPMQFVIIVGGMHGYNIAGIHWLGLLVDLLVYYLISCIVFWDYDVIRTRLGKLPKKSLSLDNNAKR
ncbi:MAG TPA: hypothetical protein VF366_08175 [Dehalococcoidia bacterium]|jgi:hypothetical protein